MCCAVFLAHSHLERSCTVTQTSDDKEVVGLVVGGEVVGLAVGDAVGLAVGGEVGELVVGAGVRLSALLKSSQAAQQNVEAGQLSERQCLL